MSLVDATELWLDAHYDDLVAWRRHIHAHPELGRQEFATTQFVASHLADAGLNPKVLPGGTGLTCDFGPEHGPRIALRADMDALPMAERTGAPYASVVPNVAHACGHDAHTAVLLGAALALASVPELPVGVRLIFQAAEELMPGGAIDAIAAGALTGVSRIFALHCDPRLAVGKVALRAGPITSAADQLEVTLQSHGGHTSRPHLTGDLVYGLGTLITGLPGVLSRRIDPRNSTVMVWGAVNAGVAANAIPQTGTLAGHHPHGQPRHLGFVGIDCARDRFVAAGSRWASSTACSTAAACRRWSTKRSRRASSPMRSRRSAPTCCATPASPAAARTSRGISRRCPARWHGWACGRAAARSSTCISRRSTWTSGRWRWVFGCWSTSSTKPPSSSSAFPRATVSVRDTPWIVGILRSLARAGCPQSASHPQLSL